MCGIIGYLGSMKASSVLLEGLSKLEYRGYDSAGIGIIKNSTWEVEKCKGRVNDLRVIVKDENDDGVGMGHTRWATHGEPSRINSHPHVSDKIVLVHNGIIENYYELRQFLKNQGYVFVSETDSEVVAHLLDYYYHDDEVKCLKEVINKIDGSYALIVAFKDKQDRLYAIRKDNPLIVAPSSEGNFLTSDITATIKYTNKYFILDPNEIAILTKEDVRIVDLDNNLIDKKPTIYNVNSQDVDKGEYEHYMLKEIYAQPTVLSNFLNEHIINNNVVFKNIDDNVFTNISKLHLVGCGSASNASLVGKRVIEKLTQTEVEVHLASEFRYYEPILKQDHLVIIVSQSGETLDTIAALRLAKEKGIKTIAICNVITSTIANEADYLIYTNGGIEIAVASTKAYLLQLAAFYLIAYKLAIIKNTLSKQELAIHLNKFMNTSEIITQTLKSAYNCNFLATSFYNNNNIFFLGRNIDYPLCIEGSLKMKEISYIHCEAFASGELKHGTISLIYKGTPIISVITQKELIHKSISNLKEVKSRGASVIVISQFEENIFGDVYDHFIKLPKVDSLLSPFSSIIILQLLAYYFALLRGNDVDKPRNLAKSVTVE